ncbi:adenosylcobinamide kinase/adenosylcobinamide phosphate guanyltransferase [Thalassobaculum fulvum]|uniref:Bifunctional adenosylcobalamin biosynthesis protein n=1 Tax=Thalassobaculum fulvum TaxID=1633335 RepID=A0A918XVD3_9PROT|nr:bifunctional adenosylcobinamide kinase/adenosylcobinamide-phosphate guanylyltransferase [Thalassobaculum fulvum]GHD56858.1 adenosylcobinamide kinase/adenosylcobinamide phosphate guanyltransferase [Thalassobaculum fulvum]
MRGRLALIVGGARSGKSRRAEALALDWGGEPVYLATAEPFDDEMRERVAQHRADRQGRGWVTVEEPLDLPAALAREATAGRTVLVECLTTWVGNLMVHDRPVEPEIARLLAGLDQGLAADLVLVANEVGLGIVPENRMARAFRDHAGRLHQELAARAGRVELVVAGIPMTVKG